MSELERKALEPWTLPWLRDWRESIYGNEPSEVPASALRTLLDAAIARFGAEEEQRQGGPVVGAGPRGDGTPQAQPAATDPGGAGSTPAPGTSLRPGLLLAAKMARAESVFWIPAVGHDHEGRDRCIARKNALRDLADALTAEAEKELPEASPADADSVSKSGTGEGSSPASIDRAALVERARKLVRDCLTQRTDAHLARVDPGVDIAGRIADFILRERAPAPRDCDPAPPAIVGLVERATGKRPWAGHCADAAVLVGHAISRLREQWERFAGFESGRHETRAKIISDALGIKDQSTTKQVAAIEALRGGVPPAPSPSDAETLERAAEILEAVIEPPQCARDAALICQFRAEGLRATPPAAAEATAHGPQQPGPTLDAFARGWNAHCEHAAKFAGMPVAPGESAVGIELRQGGKVVGRAEEPAAPGRDWAERFEQTWFADSQKTDEPANLAAALRASLGPLVEALYAIEGSSGDRRAVDAARAALAQLKGKE